MFLGCHKTICSGAAFPSQMNGAARRDSGQLVLCSDRGRGTACPICGVGVIRSSLRGEEVSAHPPPGSPCARNPRRSVVEKEKTLSTIQLDFGAKYETENQKFFKFFFISSRPFLIALWTARTLTPSLSAISRMLLPRMICASILQP